MQQTAQRRPLITAGIVIGVGLGGFFDGIVFHQILQWHHMLTSAGYPPTSVGNLEINTLADGLFHATTYVITAIGLVLLWRAVYHAHVPRSPRTLWGAALAGAGLFNLVEGLINHQILGIHHVKTGPDQVLWDVVFLASGALLVLIGVWIMRSVQAAPNR
ncbi:MAG: DUF2243 domain-containing protein [Anaerolineae bacterium]|nr:DUF2243 domain-containing protein [Anaerolineae bacterium]